jgi:carbonic anhydrase
MMVKKSFPLLGIVALVLWSYGPIWASSEGPGISPDQALSQLKEGNGRYTVGASKHPNQDPQRRKETAEKGQKPYATILSCSDSRVPVEILFDSGIGDLFIVRVAGNVADVDEIGSIEYGIDHLGTPVLLVLGHTHCGAITAVAKKAEVHGSIPELVANAEPAVARAKAANPQMNIDAMIEEAVKENAWQSIEDTFVRSEAVRKRVREGKLKVVAAIYDIESGKIDWMGPHPKEKAMVSQ